MIGAASVPLAAGQAGIRPGYVHLGEGLSSAAPGADIAFAFHRMFTIYTMDEACRASRVGDVVGLRAEPRRLTLHVSEPFSPKSLKVATLDASGRLLPRVPIVVEVKVPPGVFNMRQDVLGTTGLVPLSPGQATFRVKTICPGPAAEVFVEAEIRRR